MIKNLNVDSSSVLPNFPANIPTSRVSFDNWAGNLKLSNAWVSIPYTSNDVVLICNWAKDHGYTVRPRGCMHNWSPLSGQDKMSEKSKVIFVDTTKSLHTMEMFPGNKTVKVGVGVTFGNLLDFLEKQPGGNGHAPGFSFPHIPATEHITVGGVISINAHGSAVRTPPHDDFAASYGSISNHIMALKAVVTDPDSANPDQYQVRSFIRGENNTKAFMTQLGRSFIVEVTLQVIDNYNLRCQSFMDIPPTTLFVYPTNNNKIPKKSVADFLEKTGRLEVIWFPFTDNAFLKIWTVEPEKPASSVLVEHPNNYPFSDNLHPDLVALVEEVLHLLPSSTPLFGQLQAKAIKNGLQGDDLLGIDTYDASYDIWGSSKNTLFYIKNTTLLVMETGYAILMKKENIQSAIADIANKYKTMLDEYRKQDKYPINSPLDIRVTGLDDSYDILSNNESGGFDRPIMSSLAVDAQTKAKGWDVALWVDMLTVPGTKYSNEFFTEVEVWLLKRFNGTNEKVMPEWSKGWGYDSVNGAWTSNIFMHYIHDQLSLNRETGDDLYYVNETLSKYDKYNLFTSPLLENIFLRSPVSSNDKQSITDVSLCPLFGSRVNVEVDLSASYLPYFYPEVINGTFYNSQDKVYGPRDAIATTIYMLHPLIFAATAITYVGVHNLFANKDSTLVATPIAITTAIYSLGIWNIGIPALFAMGEFFTSENSYTDATKDIAIFGANLIDAMHFGVSWSWAKLSSAVIENEHSVTVNHPKTEMTLLHPGEFCAFGRFQKFSHIVGSLTSESLFISLRDSIIDTFTYDCEEKFGICVMGRLEKIANALIHLPQTSYNFTANALYFVCDPIIKPSGVDTETQFHNEL